MKTKEELNALKEEVETMNRKLAELTEEELIEVTGGSNPNEHNVMLTEEAPVGAAGKIKNCPYCNAIVTFNSVHHGYATCPNCGASVSF